jgi:DNA-binding response OmpR family regulator
MVAVGPRPGATTVLVVDDHAGTRQLLGHCLRDEGYRVVEARDGVTATTVLAKQAIDLVLLDLNLPDVAGLDLLRRLQQGGGMMVIVVSGRDDVRDRVAALRAGADDYIVKPFDTAEFLARVAAVLRRGAPAPGVRPALSSLRYGDLDIDLVGREVHRAGEPVALTAREFDLLAHLASAPGQVFTKRQLLEAIWASSPDWQDQSTVTEHVRRIRRKLEVDPEQPRHLITSRGAGYSFQP